MDDDLQGWWNTEPISSESLDFNVNVNLSLRHTDSILLDPPTSFSHTASLPSTYPPQGFSSSSSSASHSPPNPSSTSGSSSTDQTAKGEQPAIRKEHTKSRLGCKTCKKRRIRCPQNHPICSQCSRKGLTCTWPELQFKTVAVGGVVPNETAATEKALSMLPKQMNATLPAPTFNMQDFRLFYHFISDAHPHHPIGNEGVWTHDVPSIAHNHEYLLHAMLALAASELAPKDPDLHSTALSHRVRAITLFNSALGPGLNTIEEGNAMLATCYTLIFQSVLLEDGLAEYMTFSRGCVVVAFQMGYKKIQVLFRNLMGEDQLKTMEPHLQGEPDIEKEVVDRAVASLKAFEHLCSRDSEKEFHGALMKMAVGAYTSSRNAYMAQMSLYGLFSYKMSHVDFQSLIDPSNIVGQLLQAHMVALQVMLSSINEKEHLDVEDKRDRPYRSINWLVGIGRNVKNMNLCHERDAMKYFKWPMQIAEEVLKEAGEDQSLVKLYI